MRRDGARQLAAIAAGRACVAALLVVRLAARAGARRRRAGRSAGALQVTVDEEGATRVRDRFVIAAPIAGRVARIALDAGDAVRAGHGGGAHAPAAARSARARRGARRGSRRPRRQQRAADARVEQARAALEQAQRDGDARAPARQDGHDRDRGARAAPSWPKPRGRRSSTPPTFAARAAAFNVEAARAALLAPGGDDAPGVRRARARRRTAPCLELRSPVTGQVLRIPEESERVVAAGTPLLELGDPPAPRDRRRRALGRRREGAARRADADRGLGRRRDRCRRACALVEPSGVHQGVGARRRGAARQRDRRLRRRRPCALGDGYRVEARIVVWERRRRPEGSGQRALPPRRRLERLRRRRRPRAAPRGRDRPARRRRRSRCSAASTRATRSSSTRAIRSTTACACGRCRRR